MRILIAGATGRTGLRLTHELLENGHEPIALVRESSDTSQLPSQAETRLGDLTDLPDDIIEGVEAVVFAAGSGADTDEDATDRIDRNGAKRLVDLAAKARIDRFVMLSSVGAGDPDPSSDLAHYLDAKHDADEHLKASGLCYTIVRPVALNGDDGQRNVRFGEKVDTSAEAARGDVAAVLARAVTDDRLANRVFEMQSAETG